jgi:hypothetical protein
VLPAVCQPVFVTTGDHQYNWLTNDLALANLFVFLRADRVVRLASFDDYARSASGQQDIRNALLPAASAACK